jgi:predicted HTH transcriptional regulator
LDNRSLQLGLTYIRNHVICKIFREAEYIEKLGSGFITVFSSYAKKGLRTPEIIEGENFIKCILPRPSPLSSPIDIEEETQKIMHLFEVVEELSISEIMNALHLSRATAGRRLAQCLKQGLLEKTGKGRATGYRKIPPKY